MMDNLLCDEDWLLLPTSPTHDDECKLESCMGFNFYTTREDYVNAFILCFQKETTYMPKHGCGNHLLHARITAIHFFIKSRYRLNLDWETVFHATNYFDRFVSMNQCDAGKMEVVELIFVACLSISAKFCEVSIPQLHEIQMEDLDHTFESSAIQEMELKVLMALDWHLACVTSYSYIELLIRLLDFLQPHIHCSLTSRITELLLGALSDPKFIQFRPCEVAISALRCSLEELLPSKSDAYLSNVLSLIPQDQKVDINTCYKIIEEQVADPIHSLTASGHYCFPSSPVTVMPMQQIDTFNCYIDVSFFMAPSSNVKFPSNPKKRKREDDMSKQCPQCN